MHIEVASSGTISAPAAHAAGDEAGGEAHHDQSTGPAAATCPPVWRKAVRTALVSASEGKQCLSVQYSSCELLFKQENCADPTRCPQQEADFTKWEPQFYTFGLCTGAITAAKLFASSSSSMVAGEQHSTMLTVDCCCLFTCTLIARWCPHHVTQVFLLYCYEFRMFSVVSSSTDTYLS
jgi:hypothetical protein